MGSSGQNWAQRFQPRAYHLLCTSKYQQLIVQKALGLKLIYLSALEQTIVSIALSDIAAILDMLCVWILPIWSE